MEKLSQEYVSSCRKENGIALRGESMSRIETFVDAAFAFAYTLLVISIDYIPTNTVELLDFSRDIPAFVASSATLGFIWFNHTQWSRMFGLQDTLTAILSIVLVILVLIFVYPIKLMYRLAFSYFTDGYLSIGLGGFELGDVPTLMIYFALGFICLAVIIILFYGNALRFRTELLLSRYEIKFCRIRVWRWTIVGLTATLSCLLVLVLSEEQLPWAFYIYGSLIVTIPLADKYYWHADRPTD